MKSLSVKAINELRRNARSVVRELGFHAMQFNMVLSQNKLAIKLYERLGFNIVGTISQAVRNPDGSFQDGYVMHRKLDDL